MKTWGFALGFALMMGCGGGVQERIADEASVHTVSLSGSLSEAERNAFDDAAARVTKQTDWHFSVKIVDASDLHEIEVSPSESSVVTFDFASRRIMSGVGSGVSFEDLILGYESAIYDWRQECIRSKACR